MTLTSSFNFWAVAGMVYALAGAALFFNASFANPVPSLNSQESGGSLRRMCGQWLDSRIGAALLVIGFFLQLTGTAGSMTLNKPAVFVLLGLALFGTYYAFARDLIVERLLESSNAPALEKAASSESAAVTSVEPVTDPVQPAPEPIVASEPAAEPEPASNVFEYRTNGTANSN
jgi:hypothetical protein